eukprot:Nk52_evm34s78 gene=Nk52_evmTU34s78
MPIASSLKIPTGASEVIELVSTLKACSEQLDKVARALQPIHNEKTFPEPTASDQKLVPKKNEKISERGSTKSATGKKGKNKSNKASPNSGGKHPKPSTVMKKTFASLARETQKKDHTDLYTYVSIEDNEKILCNSNIYRTHLDKHSFFSNAPKPVDISLVNSHVTDMSSFFDEQSQLNLQYNNRSEQSSASVFITQNDKYSTADNAGSSSGYKSSPGTQSPSPRANSPSFLSPTKGIYRGRRQTQPSPEPVRALSPSSYILSEPMASVNSSLDFSSPSSSPLKVGGEWEMNMSNLGIKRVEAIPVDDVKESSAVNVHNGQNPISNHVNNDNSVEYILSSFLSVVKLAKTMRKRSRSKYHALLRLTSDTYPANRSERDLLRKNLKLLTHISKFCAHMDHVYHNLVSSFKEVKLVLLSPGTQEQSDPASRDTLVSSIEKIIAKHMRLLSQERSKFEQLEKVSNSPKYVIKRINADYQMSVESIEHRKQFFKESLLMAARDCIQNESRRDFSELDNDFVKTESSGYRSTHPNPKLNQAVFNVKREESNFNKRLMLKTLQNMRGIDKLSAKRYEHGESPSTDNTNRISLDVASAALNSRKSIQSDENCQESEAVFESYRVTSSPKSGSESHSVKGRKQSFPIQQFSGSSISLSSEGSLYYSADEESLDVLDTLDTTLINSSEYVVNFGSPPLKPNQEASKDYSTLLSTDCSADDGVPVARGNDFKPLLCHQEVLSDETLETGEKIESHQILSDEVSETEEAVFTNDPAYIDSLYLSDNSTKIKSNIPAFRNRSPSSTKSTSSNTNNKTGPKDELDLFFRAQKNSSDCDSLKVQPNEPTVSEDKKRGKTILKKAVDAFKIKRKPQQEKKSLADIAYALKVQKLAERN